MTDAFDRSQTKRATEAAQADNAAIRAIISRRLLEKANELLDQMDRPYRVFSYGGKDTTSRERILDRPTPVVLRNIMTATPTPYAHLLTIVHLAHSTTAT